MKNIFVLLSLFAFSIGMVEAKTKEEIDQQVQYRKNFVKQYNVAKNELMQMSEDKDIVRAGYFKKLYKECAAKANFIAQFIDNQSYNVQLKAFKTGYIYVAKEVLNQDFDKYNSEYDEYKDSYIEAVFKNSSSSDIDSGELLEALHKDYYDSCSSYVYISAAAATDIMKNMNAKEGGDNIQ